ncbi:cytochrome c oxidase subunit 3 [Paraperlucidibaca baekdonensis]|uniref:cytochrome-c oxidase n=1 Tax=Paraperlucidibaca baekdonensis TaxID=748120 RepID=A0A3E0H9Z2_9GAMM|nr:cytochrome c oxidase subunit 3 [Paraperlucidibaca baekdonensis]REH40519.1 cytochrome c oxidase subunit 3 [Paraperlucidibaca baekdonensis]
MSASPQATPAGEKPAQYFVPASSPWPIFGSFILFILVIGAGSVIQSMSGSTIAPNEGTLNALLPIGLLGVFVLMYFWFRDTVRESLGNQNSLQMDRSYRQGMTWFIFSEVMFFAAFFGALFYARVLSVPWLGGEGKGVMTHEVLWPQFQALWPLVSMPSGDTTTAMGPWGLPFINTVILLASSVTLTIAHHALLVGDRGRQISFLAITSLLGVIFLGCQVYEYYHAYNDLGLTLDSGIYGSTFFMLTGFHGLHVTIGTIMLIVMTLRSMKGHLTVDNHFAFEASAWYWHFVDVVWLFLFVVVYWL